VEGKEMKKQNPFLNASKIAHGVTERKMEQDELYERAEFLAQTEKHFSVSNIQRNLLIGYNRAQRLMDLLEANGVIESYDPGLGGVGYRLVTTNVELRG